MISTLSPRTQSQVRTTLPDGGTVYLRPLAGGEIAPQLEVFEGMSESSRYQRFLTSMPARLPKAVVSVLGAIDGSRHVAWLASVDGRPVGVARCVQIGGGVADVALEVVDAHHRRGVGSALLDAVVTVAAAQGVRRLTATVHPGNRASVRMLGHLGLRLRLVGGLLEGEADLRLPDPPRVDRAKVVAAASRQAELAGSLDDSTAAG